jgi:hypothetical protein
MKKIQVLALNDDNHATCFVTRGSYYSDASEFMKKRLLKPHTVEYDLRFVYICDIDEEEENLFDALACEYHPETLYSRDKERFMKREKAFDHLWSVAEKKYFWV